jgi:hypothetical protein
LALIGSKRPTFESWLMSGKCTEGYVSMRGGEDAGTIPDPDPLRLILSPQIEDQTPGFC